MYGSNRSSFRLTGWRSHTHKSAAWRVRPGSIVSTQATMAEPPVYDCTSGVAELLANEAAKRKLIKAAARKEDLGCWQLFLVMKGIHAQRPGTRFHLRLNGTDLWTAEAPTQIATKYLADEWVWRKEGSGEQVGGCTPCRNQSMRPTCLLTCSPEPHELPYMWGQKGAVCCFFCVPLGWGPRHFALIQAMRCAERCCALQAAVLSVGHRLLWSPDPLLVLVCTSIVPPLDGSRPLRCCSPRHTPPWRRA